MTSDIAHRSAVHQRLVVGFDGSDSSLSAIEWAASEGAVRGSSVRVISSYHTQPVVDFGFGTTGSLVESAETAAWCLDRLQIAASKVFDAYPGVPHDIEAVRESPAVALRHAAETADLVVVGSSGAGVVTRFLLGSVTGSLLASSPCPVVVVPSGSRPSTSRIIVGTDGSDHADHAVRWAVDEADRRGDELVVVHVWESGYHLTTGGVDRADDLTPVDAELVLDRAVEAARAIGACSVRGDLVEGRQADTLLELSKTADLLVLGSRGRGGFRAMLFGSIASAAATHSSCPTVLVR